MEGTTEADNGASPVAAIDEASSNVDGTQQAQTQLSSGSGTESSDPEGRDRNLIVNYLPPLLTENGLRNLFAPYGEIENVKLMKDKITGNSLCFGFVKFATPEAAANAIQNVNGQRLETKVLKVSLARPPSEVPKQRNVYLAQLPRELSDSDLRNIATPYGQIVDVKILRDKITGESRSCGFVQFEEHESAMAAISALNNTLLPTSQKPITARLAETAAEKIRRRTVQQTGGVMRQSGGQMAYAAGYGYPTATGASYTAAPYDAGAGVYYASATGVGGKGVGGPQAYGQPLAYHAAAPSMPQPNNSTPQGDTYCLFVLNLPKDAQDSTLYRLFGPYGAIVNVKVVTEPGTGACKGYGFVNFARYEEAVNAIKELNGANAGGNKPLQVSFKTPNQKRMQR